ncbi:benzoate/H(+) symporter BenE family transporter [uncultured Thiothrix sp.]|mgnify:CR=1 FL=1|uniref:benzoate/H(+) symporter BenE family transporter n=1 Tax=uncultured Thiothrix sp. TaxID=223185 RepID=UPI002626DFC8|nr:benzoate/H(+) symporter BenE family transporter [uncultured Thiothrix sp.]HMT94209.1 benzoate/H(+) symporter BenE family transporter [Thiolinea sp.]
MFKGFSLAHLSAGFVAVLVGYTSSAAIIFQATHTVGATEAQIASWMWALGIGMAVSSISLSLYYRIPLLTAWSTPGAALLVTSLAGVSLPEATAAFILCGILITVIGYAGWFERLMHWIPVPLASAMLAGVLLKFGLSAFVSLQQQPLLVGCMFVTFLLMKRLLPRYAIPLTLIVGMLVAWFSGLMDLGKLSLKWAQPVFVMPEIRLEALIGVGLPLFIVTMASQNIPGVAVLKANGYAAPLSKTIGFTGLTTMILAPFGGYAYNLAAITAAICMGEDVDKDKSKRYLASFSAGVFYLLAGLLGASITSLFLSFPPTLILAIAGFALISTIANSLQVALIDSSEREAALIVFLVTASGISLVGLGSAFWGLVLGLLARFWLVQKRAALIS